MHLLPIFLTLADGKCGGDFTPEMGCWPDLTVGDALVGGLIYAALIVAVVLFFRWASRSLPSGWRSSAYKREFSRVRRDVLRRDGRRCTVCGAHGPGLHVHHRLARRLGGSNSPANLTTLCPNCHHRAHRRGF